MAKPVQRMLGDEWVSGAATGPHYWGIRHLSPAGAYHLISLLNQVKPTAVLIEGPSDAGHLAAQLVARGVVPPVAMLAYTEQLPVRTLLYPFADYSPEYQALLWAQRNGSHATFIDLPTDVSLALNELRRRAIVTAAEPAEQEGDSDSSESISFGSIQHDLYARITELSGEPDYESYWERYYEHLLQPDAYQQAIVHFSATFRDMTEEMERRIAPQEVAYNEIREAYMRRRIHDAIASGHQADRIVVISGAHHTPALTLQLPIMTDDDMQKLPRAATRMTLMPYSYYKLSSHSGYGAGTVAPAYYELLWQSMKHGELDKLPALYLSAVAQQLREQGTWRSTASVIEGVRLAEALASMHDGLQPTWRDLRDAATVLFGHGELSVVAEALARIDIGTAIGSLPEGVSQTPVQDDLNRQLKRLKLEKYKSLVSADLELDLRENRRVKSEEAAYLDLNRSVFLHRLLVLGIRFARKGNVRQADATWAEHWVLQWSPEAEIETVESTLKGETIELAAAYVIHEELLAATDIESAAKLIRKSCDCGLPQVMGQATHALQQLAVDAGNFEQIAMTVHELSILLQYGSIRRIDTESLVPLLQQLFLRGTLLLLEASGCNDEAANAMVSAIHAMSTAAQEHYDVVDETLWTAKLKELAERDDRNAKLSGYAFSILLERHEAGEEQCAMEVSRRLSPGIPADIGAGWFEGLAMRNRYGLLSRPYLWQGLDQYIASLEEEPFKRSLVFLRRAFGSFEPREKAAIAELMGDLWGAGADVVGEALQRPLNEEEKVQLDELNDFDFGDL
ncbi:hypothetical protein PCCS19_03320 [Paenibacillus sp. CCS19]|uniref:DUF5682 family protein n=1 Tax=Paenibacillus sp. CCS19 TaxID=3158387 RepID=UPI00256D5F2B|nr:DUF5682 family protein [Paenibacillus cellulosilyticus]GMK37279.1 hypothetical protein PCCS19_03320 [Paenibacillus cellulosilyticus]